MTNNITIPKATNEQLTEMLVKQQDLLNQLASVYVEGSKDSSKNLNYQNKINECICAINNEINKRKEGVVDMKTTKTPVTETRHNELVNAFKNMNIDITAINNNVVGALRTATTYIVNKGTHEHEMLFNAIQEVKTLVTNNKAIPSTVVQAKKVEVIGCSKNKIITRVIEAPKTVANCSCCNVGVVQKVVDYSKKNFNNIFCIDCQKKLKGNTTTKVAEPTANYSVKKEEKKVIVRACRTCKDELVFANKEAMIIHAEKCAKQGIAPCICGKCAKKEIEQKEIIEDGVYKNKVTGEEWVVTAILGTTVSLVKYENDTNINDCVFEKDFLNDFDFMGMAEYEQVEFTPETKVVNAGF